MWITLFMARWVAGVDLWMTCGVKAVPAGAVKSRRCITERHRYH